MRKILSIRYIIIDKIVFYADLRPVFGQKGHNI